MTEPTHTFKRKMSNALFASKSPGRAARGGMRGIDFYFLKQQFVPGQQADLPRYSLRRGQFVVSLSVLFIVQEGVQNKKGTLEGHRYMAGVAGLAPVNQPLMASMLNKAPFACYGLG